jgi:hypothetical protein
MPIELNPALDPDPTIAAFVREELRARVNDGVDRALAVFLAIQSVPSRTVLQAA